MGEFKSLVPPVSKRPRSNFFGPASNWTLLRDQFTIPTWLAIGGALQGFCFLTIDRISLLPAFILLLYRVLDTYAQAVGLKHNSSMDNVDPRKVSAQPPDELGNYGSQPASQDMVVLLIGARSNHAYGALAPRFKDIGDFFRAMAEDLDSHADEFGFLGMTSWLNITDRTSNNESMNVAYFRSVEGLHAFAHSKYHRVGWDYWNKHAADCKHISIWHEVYHAPKGHWENIYINSHKTGVLSTNYSITDKETGGTMYASPIVDASKGLLKTSSGRMGRPESSEYKKLPAADPYDVKV